MEACPVSKDENMTIADLNAATMGAEPPHGKIYDFAINCVQCGRCVPVCPPGVRRDLMVLYLKYKIKDYPKSFDSYVTLKRPKISGARKLALLSLNRIKKSKVGKLYSKVDNHDLRQAEVLFYPGCYIFNEVCKKTNAILEYLKVDFEILAGYTTCCGWPQLLQGRLEMAEEMMDDLNKLINQVNPKTIITTCAECFAALRKMKAMFHTDWEVLTTTEYFMQNIDKFEIVKYEKTMGFHESCHISRKYFRYETPRNLLDKFGEWKELENNKMSSMCCYYYNFEEDPKNHDNRVNRIDEVKKVADVMVTDCITCHEIYAEKMKEEGIEVIDFNELMYNCIKEKITIEETEIDINEPFDETKGDE
jgi:Fe-S oxidoreductase